MTSADNFLDDVSRLADNHHIKVMMEHSGRGAAICGTSVFLGMKLFNLCYNVSSLI